MATKVKKSKQHAKSDQKEVKGVHQGKKLRTLVDADPRDVQDIAKAMGYTRTHLYNMYKQPEFKPNAIVNMAKAGIYLDDSHKLRNLKPVAESFGTDLVRRLEERIADLERTEREHADDLRALNSKFNELAFQLLIDGRRIGKK